MLTTGWFDTNDEFEAHRRVLKNKLRMSVGNDGEYADPKKAILYKSYKDMGGIKGSLIMGGPDAFDFVSKTNLDGIVSSIGEHEEND